MTRPTASKPPEPFDAARYKPLEEMEYSDRVAVWKDYCKYRKLCNDFQVYTDSVALKYVEAQVSAIKASYIDKFTPTDLINPEFL